MYEQVFNVNMKKYQEFIAQPFSSLKQLYLYVLVHVGTGGGRQREWGRGWEGWRGEMHTLLSLISNDVEN